MGKVGQRHRQRQGIAVLKGIYYCHGLDSNQVIEALSKWMHSIFRKLAEETA